MPSGHRLSTEEIAFIAEVERSSTVDEVAECIRAYYEDLDNPTGGALHIVLDDFNYEDASVEHCIEWAERGGRGVPPDPLGAALGRRLLTMSLAERAAANYPALCSLCGHSMSLHYRAISPTAGMSCQGRCRVDGCGCEDGSAA